MHHARCSRAGRACPETALVVGCGRLAAEAGRRFRCPLRRLPSPRQRCGRLVMAHPARVRRFRRALRRLSGPCLRCGCLVVACLGSVGPCWPSPWQVWWALRARLAGSRLCPRGFLVLWSGAGNWTYQVLGGGGSSSASFGLRRTGMSGRVRSTFLGTRNSAVPVRDVSAPRSASSSTSRPSSAYLDGRRNGPPRRPPCIWGREVYREGSRRSVSVRLVSRVNLDGGCGDTTLTTSPAREGPVRMPWWPR